MASKIPVTIITGFLGSGKTTLIRNLIQNANGRRLAVIVNEFGEMGIDGEILKSCCSNEDDVLELNNGCLCCTVQEEFLPVMLQLMERKDTIDHIIIETSGLALPKPLLHAFNWPELKPQITVDAVVTVVDVVGQATGEICDRERVQGQRLADDSLDHETPIEELFEDQLSCADLVVMTKKDLVEDAQYEEVKAIIAGKVRPDVKMVAAANGVLSTDILLGVNAAAENDLESRHSHHEEDHANGLDHHHDDDIDSVVVDITAPHTPEALVEALKELIEEYEIYRIKGFIDVPGKPMRMVLQGVSNRFDQYFDRKWKDSETRKTSLVIIGDELHDKDLATIINEKLTVVS
ncbi:cobalamin biosynthesis protein CobW [Chitinophaga pinensis]|uniref:Cobalamin biosynthesis protein CobW n=1 Tax=Chitinophaga pinensis (strain ATCC 43595 / DSM 2588 / LMG 13176 / NBRC 15968 / NCIMB 11800 / UQM 2034) TaxID=485918 RepID=A0A979G703_CHIPD|nr:cobalamin biosynthesis protein CobW [Chitinophaga pinensis]ACU61931.1 cobalamin biosynthesis protein CobW [Chitinophaga pinensis DSM 2588]